MSLIIEDGSIVADANSYVTVIELDTYCSNRGITLSATTEAEKEALSFKAMDYIECNVYQGYKTNTGQSLQFPRYPVYIDNQLIDSNAIPATLKKAQLQLMVEIDNGFNPLATTEQAVIREKVDVLEVEYDTRSSQRPQLKAVNAFLSPLLGAKGLGLNVSRT